MNIARQYKLYRLGIEIPPTSLDVIAYVETTLNKLTIYNNSYKPEYDYYVDSNGNNVCYLEDRKDGFLRCTYHGFWDVLKYDYGLRHKEIQDLLKLMVNHHLNLHDFILVHDKEFVE